MDRVAAAQTALLDQGIKEAVEVTPEDQALGAEIAEEGIQEVLRAMTPQGRPQMGIIARIKAVILQVQITLLGMEIVAMTVRQEDPTKVREVKVKKALLTNRLKNLQMKRAQKKVALNQKSQKVKVVKNLNLKKKKK